MVSVARALGAGSILAFGLLATPALAGTISYTYDNLGRLAQVQYPDGAILQYNYDANGNRTTYIVTGSPNSPPGGTTSVGQATIVSNAVTAPKSSSPAPSAN